VCEEERIKMDINVCDIKELVEIVVTEAKEAIKNGGCRTEVILALGSCYINYDLNNAPNLANTFKMAMEALETEDSTSCAQESGL
jgi:hypothetical protein